MKNRLFTGHIDAGPLRCTGRSTAQALGVLSAALANPGIAVTIRDHWGTRNADEYLATVCRQMVSILGLKFIEISTSSKGVTAIFNLYE